jgi:beta-glucosidase
MRGNTYSTQVPIWVTENGLDDRAYLHWSLMDNFEWLEGFGPRFGLYRVNFDTLERSKTEGAKYFEKIARSRVLVAP